MLKTVLLPLLLASNILVPTQDKATKVKGALPTKAQCFICMQNGETELEKPAGGVAYKEKTYYFCNKAELDAFINDPEAYIPAPVPRTAAPFALKSTTGTTVTLADMRGKVVLVDFWATWCAPCVKGMPDLQKLRSKYASNGLEVLGVSIDDNAEQKVPAFLKKSKLVIDYPILFDSGDTWKQWGVKSIPSVILVRDGEILKHWSGKIDIKAIESTVQTYLRKP